MNSISEYFAEDHDRIDVLFAEFQSLKRKDPSAAKEKFKDFLKGLTRHIIWEEDVLFPIFEKRMGMRDSGPTAVMRLDHREIKKHLDAIHDKVRVADPDSDASEKALLTVLHHHNLKEENVLYPAIDRYLDQAGINLAQKEMDAIPDKRYTCCCQAH